MQYKYNLTAVGLISRFPYVSLGRCMGLDCRKPGAEIANGSADITLGTVFQNNFRYKQVDFTVPIGAVYVGYVIKESTHIEVGDYIADAFRGYVMLLVMIAGFTVSCLLHLFTKLLTSNSSSIFDFLEFAVAGYFKNSNFNPKEPFCSRILVCAWLLFTFTLTEYYGARLQSVLSLTHYRGALFTNLDEAMDAIQYQGWKMVFKDKDYSPLLYCYGAQCTRMRELQKRSLILYVKNVSLEAVSETDHHFGFGGKASDRVPYEETVLDDSKRILFVRGRLITPMHQSYAVSKKMPVFLEKLNRAMAHASSGFRTIRSRYERSSQQYVDKFVNNANVMSLIHLKVLFAWTWKLLVFSIAYLLGEVVYFRYGPLPLRWIGGAHRFVLSTMSDKAQDSIELTKFSYKTK